MTTETTTTAVESTTTAPVETAPVETTASPVVEQASTATPEVPVEQASQAEPEEINYDWVPKKFLRDGKPDFENMAKSYVNLEKKAGQKGLLVPEDLAEYEFTPNDYVGYDEARVDEFKSEAQKAGLSKEQYAFMMSKYESVVTDLGLNPEASEAVLKNEWGKDYNEHLSFAGKAFMEYAPSEMNMSDPIFNHPQVLKLLSAIGRDLGEDSQAQTKGRVNTSGVGVDDIRAIQNSPDYWTNPAKQEKVRAWYEKQYG